MCPCVRPKQLGKGYFVDNIQPFDIMTFYHRFNRCSDDEVEQKTYCLTLTLLWPLVWAQ